MTGRYWPCLGRKVARTEIWRRGQKNLTSSAPDMISDNTSSNTESKLKVRLPASSFRIRPADGSESEKKVLSDKSLKLVHSQHYRRAPEGALSP